MGYEITIKLYTIAAKAIVLEINPWSKKSMVIIWNWSGMDCDIFGGGASSHFGARGLGAPRAPPVPLQAR